MKRKRESRASPPPEPLRQVHLRPVPDRPAPPPPPPRGPTLTDVAWALLQGRRVILVATGAALLLGVAYLLAATPAYEASTLVLVEEKTKPLTAATDVTAMLDVTTPVDTSMEAMRSRTLVGSVVDQLGLDVDVRPPTAQWIQDGLWRRVARPDPATFAVGPGRYGRGRERVVVQRLSVPPEFRGAPLRLRSLGERRFTLESADGGLRLTGEVGRPADAAVGDDHVEVLVTEMSAAPGVTWTVRKTSRSQAIERLQSDLRISEKGRKTGMVQLTLGGADPTVTALALNAVARAYQSQHVAQKSEEASSTLAFLESQLPTLKANLERAESGLNEFRRDKGTVDLSREASMMVERSAAVERSLTELGLQRAELRQRYTEDHPSVVTLDRKVETLRAEHAAMQHRLRGMPETERSSVQLLREVKVASELYSQLLNKVQELRIVRAGTIGNVRIVDEAEVPERPASPRRGMVLLLAILLGAGGGAALVIVRHGLDEGMDDPGEIEAATGIPVFVTIPHSESQVAKAKEGGPSSPPGPVLATVDPGDPSVEALRSLCAALELAAPASDRNVIAVSSPGPGVGKSFVSLNLAHVLAAGGRRVVLVDGDLRRGQLHDHFGLARQPGLSDVAAGGATLQQALRPTGVERLDFLSTGTVPERPAELLSGTRVPTMLAELSRRYDVVLVDTPPALAVSDPALLARHAGMTLLVLRAGHHTAREIALTLDRLQRSGAQVTATVLNDARSLMGRYGRYGHYNRYEYRSDRQT